MAVDPRDVVGEYVDVDGSHLGYFVYTQTEWRNWERDRTIVGHVECARCIVCGRRIRRDLTGYLIGWKGAITERPWLHVEPLDARTVQHGATPG